VVAISEALKRNTSLTTLDLHDNEIGDIGLKSISNVLPQNSSLIELNLYDNSIGDEGATIMSQALKQNTSLTKLPLSDNSIEDEVLLTKISVELHENKNPERREAKKKNLT